MPFSLGEGDGGRVHERAAGFSATAALGCLGHSRHKGAGVQGRDRGHPWALLGLFCQPRSHAAPRARRRTGSKVSRWALRSQDGFSPRAPTMFPSPEEEQDRLEKKRQLGRVPKGCFPCPKRQKAPRGEGAALPCPGQPLGSGLQEASGCSAALGRTTVSSVISEPRREPLRRLST